MKERDVAVKEFNLSLSDIEDHILSSLSTTVSIKDDDCIEFDWTLTNENKMVTIKVSHDTDWKDVEDFSNLDEFEEAGNEGC